MPTSSTRRRRSPEEQIADLRGQVARIQDRAERRKAKADPTIRYVSAAVRSIDKALGVSGDVATRHGLDEARVTLAAVLSLNGAVPRTTRRQARVVVHRRAYLRQVQPEEVLRFIATHPGCRCEDAAAALAADTKSVSAVLKGLKDDGRVRSEGQKRGTRYFVMASE